MKQSFTYSGDSKTKRDAMRHAKKVGVKNFSDLVEGLLKQYANIVEWRQKSDKWDSLGESISKFYCNGEGEYDELQPEEHGDLVEIGEVAARAYGWL